MPISRIDSSRDLLRIWFYWKRHAIMIFFIIFIMIMGFAYIATPLYRATASVVILPRSVEGAVISSGPNDSRIADVKQQDINTEIELLYSNKVLRDTIESFVTEKRPLGLRKPSTTMVDKIVDYILKKIKDTLIFFKLVEKVSPFDAMLEQLRSAIEVEPIAMSNIILITLEAERPKATSVVLNRLLDIYIKHHGQVYTQDEGVEFYNHQSEKFKTKLAVSEDQLKAFQHQYSIIDLERQNIANIDHMTRINDDLQRVEVSIAEIQSKIKSLKAGFGKDIILTRDMKHIPAIAEIEKALVPLYIQKSEILKNYTKDSREYQSIDEQINILLLEIRKEVEKAIQTEDLEYASLKAMRESLMVELGNLQKTSNETSQKKTRFNELEREVTLAEKNYMLYSSKKEDALINSDRTLRNLANISINSKAEVPPKAYYPNRLLFLIISILIGIAAACGSPFILEFIDHRIKFSHDVEKFLAIPVISSIPEE